MSAEAGHRALKKMRRMLAEHVARGKLRGDPEREEVLACIIALCKTYGDPDPPPARADAREAFGARLARDSLPPMLEANKATRATADAHFKESRRILEGLK